MAKFNAAESVNFSQKFEEENRIGKARKAAFAVLAACGVGAGTVFGMGTAEADKLWVGGCGDPAGQFIGDTARAQGRWAPGDEQAQYPASMAPVCGNVSTADSLNIGGDAVVDFYERHKFDPSVDVEGFSEGAGVVNNGTMKLAQRYGGVPANYHPVTVGDGWSPAGVLNHPVAALASPITRGIINIPTTAEVHPLPGTTVRFDAGDFFAATNIDPWNIPEQIWRWVQSGANGAHRIPDPNEPHRVVIKDGLRYEIYGERFNEIADKLEFAVALPGGNPAEVPGGMLQDFLANGAPMGNAAPSNPGSYTVRHSGGGASSSAGASHNVAPSVPKATITEHVVVQRDSKTGKKSVVRPHVSMNFSTHQ